MQFVEGMPRDQLYLIPTTLEDTIARDNEVRFIEAFVESLDLKAMGFGFPQGSGQKGGRPAYHPSVLLKLYLYGYLNRIRSSRALERECGRNIELMWLLQGRVPDHNTISNFRKNHSAAIREVFRSTVRTADRFNLLGKCLLAGDSTKLRAQNSKKNNFNLAKIDRHLLYIDTKLAAYHQTLDGADTGVSFRDATFGIYRLRRQRNRYQKLRRQLQHSGQGQVSTSDPDSRQLIIRNNITEVAYNVQTTVDAQEKILVDFLVTNANDSRAMGTMLERATEELQTNKFTALYDKGYHSGSELEKAEALKVKVMVAIPEAASQAPDARYNLEAFHYDAKKNRYRCPEGHELKTNGKWYTKTSRSTTIQVQHFKTNRCKQCPVKDLCTRNPKGRVIERSQYSPLVEANKARIQKDPETYKLRQQLVEHPYGTIKRQWGFDHIMTKRFIERASADVGLIFTAYNLKRLFHLLADRLINSPKGWKKRKNLGLGSTLSLITGYWSAIIMYLSRRTRMNYTVLQAS